MTTNDKPPKSELKIGDTVLCNMQPDPPWKGVLLLRTGYDYWVVSHPIHGRCPVHSTEITREQ
jgi:hypothetical protein